MTIVNGTSTSDYYYIRFNYTLSSTAETTSCAITLQLYWKKHHSHNLSNERPVYVNGTGQSQVNFYPTGSYEKDAGGVVNLGTTTYSWSRGTANATKTISGYAKRSTGSTSSVSTTITVPARTSVAVTYEANTPAGAGTVQNLPAAQAKYYNLALTLSSTIPTLENYVFDGWNTAADGSGTAYAAGGTLPASVNTATTLYAQWAKVYVSPSVESISLIRTETSSSTDLYDEGNYLCVTLSNYASGNVPADGSSQYKQTTVTAAITKNGVTTALTALDSNTFTGTGASKGIHFPVPTATYPTSESYQITLTFTTTGHGSVTRTVMLASSVYPIDVAADASTISFGIDTIIKKELYIKIPDKYDSSTVDGQIYDALVALGWDSDVIV